MERFLFLCRFENLIPFNGAKNWNFMLSITQENLIILIDFGLSDVSHHSLDAEFSCKITE